MARQHEEGGNNTRERRKRHGDKEKMWSSINQEHRGGEMPGGEEGSGAGEAEEHVLLGGLGDKEGSGAGGLSAGCTPGLTWRLPQHLLRAPVPAAGVSFGKAKPPLAAGAGDARGKEFAEEHRELPGCWRRRLAARQASC